jgi:acetyltransferase-like isoleucine patch superfamily enzyme
LYFRLFRRSVHIGLPFAAYGPVRICGPGRVRIGQRCAVVLNVFEGLTITTAAASSQVSIGEGSLLGGLTIRCSDRVEIGARSMTARSLVQDAPFLHADEVRSRSLDRRCLLPSATVLGENVWVGGECVVLGGCAVGKDSVLSAGAWCQGAVVGDYCLVGGNPAGKGLGIERLLRLRGVR